MIDLRALDLQSGAFIHNAFHTPRLRRDQKNNVQESTIMMLATSRDEIIQVVRCSHSDHEFAFRICHYGEIVMLQELLQLGQLCPGCNNSVRMSFAPFKARSVTHNRIIRFCGPCLPFLLERRNVDVSDRFSLFGKHRDIREVAFICHVDGFEYPFIHVQSESWWQLKILNNSTPIAVAPHRQELLG